ncbi:hypothetical protein I5Z76_02909 [Escherichia coli]|jgi:hypothetical protein|nr:MAG TPA: Minor tail protein U [Bacteriophage sp.]
MKHTDIRAAVLDALEQHEHGATLFDGRPVVFDEEDFPAIAVYLTDAEYTGEELDADTWRATLHIEVFLPAQAPAFTGCPCPLHRRAIFCCAALVLRYRTMPPFTAATVSCFTICLNN